MKTHLAIIVIILVGILGFIIGYSVAPTDVDVVRHGAPTVASSGGEAGGYGSEDGGYGGGGYGAESGGYGAESGGYGGGYGAPAGGGYGAPAAGGYGAH